VDSGTGIVPRDWQDADFETPFSRPGEDIEPAILPLLIWVSSLGRDDRLDVAWIQVHPVDNRLAIFVEPEGLVICVRWGVRRIVTRVSAGAFISTSDETANTGSVRGLFDTEGISECISLVFTEDCPERPLGIIPHWIIGIVVEVVVNGLFKLLVLVPTRNWSVRAGVREIIH
jgi:hypothetical protein